MVLDIRKDLLQRKQKSPNSKGTPVSNPHDGSLVRDSEPAENLAGPSCPPLSYDPLVFSIHNSLSREAQPRPLRVPCSACTFVPHIKQYHALSHNGLRHGLHANHNKPHATVVIHGDHATVDEEPCAEDIAGHYHSFTVQRVASIQPIRVACSACTSSLRPPLFYGHPAAAPKVKPRKRGKQPNLASTEAMAMAAPDCPAQDLHDHRESERAAADCGWFVRPEQGACLSPSSSAMVQRSSHSAALEKKKIRNVVPVEGGRFHKVERGDGHSPDDQSIGVTEDISDMISDDTQAAAGKEQYQHDCFVKRVERACAIATGSKCPAAERSKSSQKRTSSLYTSRHGRQNDRANARAGKPQRHAAAALAGDDQRTTAVASEGEGTILCNQQLPMPAAGVADRSDAAENVIQAVSNVAPTSIEDGTKRQNTATMEPRLRSHKERPTTDLQKSKSASQEHHSAVVQPEASAAAAVGKKNDQKLNTYEGAAMKKRNASDNRSSKESGSTSQITSSSSDSQSQMVGSSASKTRKSGEDEEDTKKEKPLRLSVEVFPSPSAPKGFGLKIVQHFPKTVEVEYVNGLGLSPRSFQTLPCQGCSSSPPLEL